MYSSKKKENNRWSKTSVASSSNRLAWLIWVGNTFLSREHWQNYDFMHSLLSEGRCYASAFEFECAYVTFFITASISCTAAS
mmetsp:Transcript_3073/g.6630  ORF Transcript_3073/g.6630 Transcript_3073/m.6630 type:complete len:82 (-) Transcript_3073:1062-1307(-)